jgi:opine dehydrogenase
LAEPLRITVCGGGRAGTAIAADLALMGHRINLYEVAKLRGNVEEIRKRGGIELTGDTQSGRTGFAKLSMIGSDPKKAVEGADLIMITAPAFAHQEFFNNIVPFLTEGQGIVVNTGYWASLRFAPLLEEARLTGAVTIAETNIMPYAADRLSPTKTHILKKKREMKFAAYPGNKTDSWFSTFRRLYPQTRKVPNVLWTNLAAGNPPIHAPMTVPMAGIMYDRYKVFKFYAEATAPGARLVEACDGERLAVAEKLGVKTETEFDWFKKTYGYSGKDIADALRKSEHADMWTPVDFHSALLQEDLNYFYVPMTAIGDQIGVPTPICKSVISLLGAMLSTDYWRTGVTLRTLGFEGLSSKEMVRFVNTGKRG